MTWTITVKPTNAALSMWAWSAIRADQETVLSGTGHPTSEGALSTAKAMIGKFEDSDGAMRDATITVEYDPEEDA